MVKFIGVRYISGMEKLQFILNLPKTAQPRIYYYTVAFLCGLAVALLLILFQPFGTYTFQHELKYLILGGYGLVIFMSILVCYEAVWLLLPQHTNSTAWNLGKEFSFILFFFTFAVTACYFYHHLVIGSHLSFKGFFLFFFFATSVGIIPIGFIFLWSYQKAKSAMIKEKAIEAFKSEHRFLAHEPILRLEGTNKNELVKFIKSELLLIASSDNYVEIVLSKGGKTQKHLLRATLSNISEQLVEQKDIVRIHRSYLINATNSLTLGGKAPAYFVTFDDYPALGEIPVSRQQIEIVRQIIADKLL